MQKIIFSFVLEMKETEAWGSLIGGSVPKVPGAAGHEVFWLHLCSLANRRPHGFTHGQVPEEVPIV